MLMKKKVITRTNEISLDDIEGPITNLIETLTTYYNDHGPTTRIYVEWYYDSARILMQWDEQESDAEFAKRMEKSRKQSIARAATLAKKLGKQQEDERQLYNILKEKYG